MPTAYAYLVISPNPQLGNFICTGDGVEVAKGEKDNMEQEGDELKYKGSIIHYIKIGHQSGLEDRFSAYNTHNPSMWFRHIEFEKPLNEKAKSQKLEAAGTKTAAAKSKSAKYVEALLLDEVFEKAAHAAEWFVLKDGLDSLHGLCEDLNKERRQKRIEKGEIWLYGDVNVFNHEDDCVTFMRENRGELFPRK